MWARHYKWEENKFGNKDSKQFEIKNKIIHGEYLIKKKNNNNIHKEKKN